MIGVRPSGCIRKFNVGVISQTMIPSIIKLCVIITTMELYTLILLLLTSDPYQGHGVKY